MSAQDLGKITVTTNGDYNAATTYEKLCLVRYEGATYVSKQTTTGNTPSASSQYWQLVSTDGDTITTDATPTSGSTNAVQSGGVYTALAGKVNTDGTKVLTPNPVVITASSSSAPSDTTALWVYPAS